MKGSGSLIAAGHIVDSIDSILELVVLQVRKTPFSLLF
jgi:hypothetical protein